MNQDKKLETRHLNMRLAEVGGWNRAGRLVNRASGGRPHPNSKLARNCERLAKRSGFIERCRELATASKATKAPIAEPRDISKRQAKRLRMKAGLPIASP